MAPPQIADRALKLISDARIEVLAGGHVPFLNDAERCVRLIEHHT